MRITTLFSVSLLVLGCDPEATRSAVDGAVDAFAAVDAELPDAGRPAEPEPAEPDPAEPEPAEPEPAEPEPAEPEPAEPEPAEPEPAEPEPSEPEPVEPEPAEPEPAEPEPAEPEPVEPAVCDPYLIGPDDRVDGWYYVASIRPNGGPLAGMCPVSDRSIRAGGDALFAYTARTAGTHVFRNRGSVTMVSLHAACDRVTEPLWCAQSPHHHDQDLGRWPFNFSRDLAVGETIYIQLDGYRPNQLGLAVYPPVPTGEACGQVAREPDGYSAFARCGHGANCRDDVCVDRPPPAADGEACGAFQDCADGLLCFEDTCQVPPAPRVLSSWAHWHAGRVFVELRLFDPARLIDLPGLVAGDVRLQLSGGSWYGADGTRRLAGSQRLDVRPAELLLADGAGEVWDRVPVVDQPVAAPGEQCHWHNGLDRCVVASICGGPEADRRCHAAEVHVWEDRAAAGHIVLDVRGSGLTTGHQFTAGRGLQRMYVDDTRWIGRTTRPVEEGPFDVHHGVDLVAGAVPVERPPVLAPGAACDMQRIADWCPEGTACLAGACQVIHAPVIEAAEVVRPADGPGAGLWVRGRDPEGDVAGWMLGERAGDFADPWRDPWWGWDLIVDGDRFEGWVSHRDWHHIGLVEVRLTDREGLTSAPFPVAVSDADRPAAAVDAACDPSEVLTPCVADAVCDVDDGRDAAPTCRPRDAACPAGLARPLFVDERVDIAGLEDDRSATLCRAGAGPEQHFEFVAPADARYSFEVRGPGFAGVAVRRSCLHPRTEIACGEEFVRLDNFGTVGSWTSVELSAGEQVVVIVDGLSDFDILARQWPR